MRRRDRDPRPPVEVLGGDAPPDAAQRVAIGRPRGAGPGRGVVVAAVVALLIGGAVIGGGDDDPDASSAEDEEEPEDARSPLDERGSSTTRPPRRTTTTTTTTLPTGPVLPSQTGGGLLVVGPGSTGTYVDLDTGARHEVSLGSSDYWQFQAVRGGVVIVEPRRAVYLPLPAGEPVDLGSAERVLGSGDPGRVWLLSGAGFEQGDGVPAQVAVLTDLGGRRLTDEIDVPTCCVIGATDGGVAFMTGGRTYVAEEAGVRPLVDGHVVQVVENRVVRMHCDDQAVCETELLDLGSGRSTGLGAMPDPNQFGSGVVVSPEGKVAIVLYGPTGATVVLHGADGRELGRLDLRQGTEPAWLPGDHGLVTVGSGLMIERIYDRNSTLVSEPIPALQGLRGETVLVIPP